MQVNYIRRRTARGRRRAVPARYPPPLWNLYEAVRQKEVRTNNLSERWQNRFVTAVGKAHPSIFNSLIEIQKEQADTESMLSQLALGKTIKKNRAPRIQRIEDRLFNIVSQYATRDTMEYLGSIGQNLTF